MKTKRIGRIYFLSALLIFISLVLLILTFGLPIISKKAVKKEKESYEPAPHLKSQKLDDDPRYHKKASLKAAYRYADPFFAYIDKTDGNVYTAKGIRRSGNIRLAGDTVSISNYRNLSQEDNDLLSNVNPTAMPTVFVDVTREDSIGDNKDCDIIYNPYSDEFLVIWEYKASEFNSSFIVGREFFYTEDRISLKGTEPVVLSRIDFNEDGSLVDNIYMEKPQAVPIPSGYCITYTKREGNNSFQAIQIIKKGPDGNIISDFDNGLIRQLEGIDISLCFNEFINKFFFLIQEKSEEGGDKIRLGEFVYDNEIREFLAEPRIPPEYRREFQMILILAEGGIPLCFGS